MKVKTNSFFDKLQESFQNFYRNELAPDIHDFQIRELFIRKDL